ncbi:hypothetical protein GJ496_005016 [Pomphorhynchus laevis]|nr:hypothetical protein GJ496_005016 [Pomphorhynchus laevis]
MLFLKLDILVLIITISLISSYSSTDQKFQCDVSRLSTFDKLDVFKLGYGHSTLLNNSHLIQASDIVYICSTNQNGKFNRQMTWPNMHVNDHIDSNWSGKMKLKVGDSIRRYCRPRINESKYVYTWITMQTRSNKKVVGTGTLNIDNVQFLHNGMYSCNILLQDGRRGSQLFRLDVVGKPSLSVEGYEDTFNVDHFLPIEIECPLDAYITPVYSWYIRRTNSIQFTPINYHKRILKLKKDKDSIGFDGYVLCKARNQAGSAKVDFKLTIDFPPQFTDFNKYGVEKIAVRVVKNPVILHCPIIAHPISRYEWFFDNQYDMHPEIQLDVNSSILYIKSMSTSDVGTYRCKLTNAYGSKEVLTTLLDRDSLLWQIYKQKHSLQL